MSEEREDDATQRLLCGMLRLRYFTVTELASNSGVKLSTARSFLDRNDGLVEARPLTDAKRRGRPRLHYGLLPERKDEVQERIEELRRALAPGTYPEHVGRDIPAEPPTSLPSLVTLQATLAELEASTKISERGDLIELADILIAGTEQADRDRETTWNIVNLVEREAIKSARTRIAALKTQIGQTEITPPLPTPHNRGALMDSDRAAALTVRPSSKRDGDRKIVAPAAELEATVHQLMDRGWERIKRVVKNWGAWVGGSDQDEATPCIFLFDTIDGPDPLSARVEKMCLEHNIRIAKFNIVGFYQSSDRRSFRTDVEEMFRLAPQTWFSQLLFTGDSTSTNNANSASIRDLLGATEPRWLHENWSESVEDIMDQRIQDRVRELTAEIMLDSSVAAKPIKLSPTTGLVVASLIGRSFGYPAAYPRTFNTSNPIATRMASFLDVGLNGEVARLAQQHHCRYVANALDGSFDDEILRPSPYALARSGASPTWLGGIRRFFGNFIKPTVAES
jgi:hypothetical protein